jgi:DNA-binding Lrp family transcriptional regulator
MVINFQAKTMANNFQKQIRNLNNGQWYWIARKVLRANSKRIGPSGIAVYNVLASYADSKTQTCFPTRKTIARVLGLSRKTVTRKILMLQELGLISIEKAGISYRYLLLEPSKKGTNQTSGRENNNTSQGTPENTNNNQRSNINNNNERSDKLKGFTPHSRTELLACDLSEALSDRQTLSIYLLYAKRYPENLLRKILGQVMEIPDEQIKKSRAALFHYLVQKYAPKSSKDFRD